MIPEPITATIRNAGAERLGDQAAGQVEPQLPGAGLGSTRVRVARVSSSLMTPPDATTTASIRSRSSARRARRTRRAVPTGDRVGDRPVQPRRSGVELLVGPVAHRDRPAAGARPISSEVGGVAPVRSKPARRAAATAPGERDRPGGCRADAAAAPVELIATARRRAASGPSSRVHTNSTGPGRTCGGRCAALEQRVRARDARSGGDRRRSTGAARSARPLPRTSRWWASRFDSIPNRRRSSTGARSDNGELVDDRQPRRITQRGVARGPLVQSDDAHRPQVFHSVTLESIAAD